MGFYFHGLPGYLTDWAARVLPGAVAVETGTLNGDSALALAEAFGRCVTVEKQPELAARARERFRDDPRITVMEGSSREVLPGVVADLAAPPFAWLDAHWSGGVTAGADDPCPVLAEIEALAARFAGEAVVAVDDARIFGLADPRDEVNNAWPSLLEVLTALADHGWATFVVDDVMVGVPHGLADSFGELAPLTWMGQQRTLSHFVAAQEAQALSIAARRARASLRRRAARLRTAARRSPH